ncbi:MAG TPA: hypothetical protein VGE55_00800 [Limnobacter sp.]|uniref:hypothetical protein n=1 Tax=Limnobacter sp. TaxID=2003368 RepID=UPI002ED94600
MKTTPGRLEQNAVMLHVGNPVHGWKKSQWPEGGSLATWDTDASKNGEASM